MTPLDVRVLDTVREQIAGLGYPPTLRFLARQLDVSVTAIAKSYDRLEALGKLTRRPGATRGVEIAGQPDLRIVPTEDLEIELGRRGVNFRALSRIEPQQRGRGAPCAATVCDQSVGRGHLFCRRHWFIIPTGVREEILAAFGRRDERAYEMAITRARDIIDGCDDGFRRVG